MRNPNISIDELNLIAELVEQARRIDEPQVEAPAELEVTLNNEYRAMVVVWHSNAIRVILHRKPTGGQWREFGWLMVRKPDGGHWSFSGESRIFSEYDWVTGSKHLIEISGEICRELNKISFQG